MSQQGSDPTQPAPQIGSVRAERDVNIATNQTIINIAPRPEAIALEWLLAVLRFLQQKSAHQPAPSVPPEATLLAAASYDIRQAALDGLLNWIELVEGTPGTLSHEIVQLMLCSVCMPLIKHETWTNEHTKALAAISGTALATWVETQNATWKKFAPGQSLSVDQVTQELGDSTQLSDVMGLLQALSDSAIWQRTLDERRYQLLKQRFEQPKALPTHAKSPPTLEQQRMRELVIAAAGAAAGAVIAYTAQAILESSTVSAQASNQALSPVTSTLTEAPQHPILHIDTAPTHAAPLTIPVTTAEWQASLKTRDRVFGRHGLHQNPVPYWCYVPAGTYPIGGWEKGNPIADIKLAEYWIARVPITVAQYRPFVAVGYRADAQHWWTPNG